jgi:ferredoxin/vacuolar-type H+-ATPase subunit F/Vma7
MRSGILVCTASLSPEQDRAINRLQSELDSRGVKALFFGQDLVAKEPERISEFIALNELQTLVIISGFASESARERLRGLIERSGLGRLAAAYLDIGLLPLGEGEADDNGALTVALVNLAKMERADYIANPVFKTVLRQQAVSRRDLLRSVRRALTVESDVPIVLEERCEPRGASCDYCREACPVNAISQIGQTVAIDSRLCIECSACARECPTGAIQSPSISDAQIMAMLNTLSRESQNQGQRPLLLTCSLGLARLSEEAKKGRRSGSGIIPVGVPCVAAIGSAHYLWASSLGVGLVTVCPDPTCKNVTAVGPLHEHKNSCAVVLSSLDDKNASAIEHLMIGKDDSIVDRIQQVASPTGVENNGTELSSSRRREVMLEAFAELKAKKHARFPVLQKSTLPFFDVTIDTEKCSFCELCQNHCPDQAIKFVRGETAMDLTFDFARCTGCRICEKTCPEGALKVSRLLDLSIVEEGQRQVKAEDPVAKCERCGASMGSKRSMESLERKLSTERFSPVMLERLHLCVACRREILVRPA